MAVSHHSSIVMLILLVLFAVIHSGGAALRQRAEARIGARAWRLLFASASIPSAVVVIGWFLAHRYDGIRLWNLQGVPGMVPLVWIGTAVSFLSFTPPPTPSWRFQPSSNPRFGCTPQASSASHVTPRPSVRSSGASPMPCGSAAASCW